LTQELVGQSPLSRVQRLGTRLRRLTEPAQQRISHRPRIDSILAALDSMFDLGHLLTILIHVGLASNIGTVPAALDRV
jgi:hypothetical protein